MQSTSSNIVLRKSHQEINFLAQGLYDVTLDLNLDTDYLNVGKDIPKNVPFIVCIKKKAPAMPEKDIKCLRYKMPLGSATHVSFARKIHIFKNDSLLVTVQTTYKIENPRVVYQGDLQIYRGV